MSLESNSDSQPITISPIIQSEFARGKKLTADAGNIWQTVSMWFRAKTRGETQPPLEPCEHYEEYIRHTSTPEEADWIMDQSDQEAVAAFNQIVDDFNARLEELIEGDISDAQIYINRYLELDRN